MLLMLKLNRLNWVLSWILVLSPPLMYLWSKLKATFMHLFSSTQRLITSWFKCGRCKRNICGLNNLLLMTYQIIEAPLPLLKPALRMKSIVYMVNLDFFFVGIILSLGKKIVTKNRKKHRNVCQIKYIWISICFKTFL